jgi:uncharacterized iron-regulated protein
LLALLIQYFLNLRADYWYKNKMKTLLLFILWLLCSFRIAYSQEKPAYQLFTAKGKKTTYAKLFKAVQQSEIIFFGELHYDPIAHWLQFELVKDTYLNKQQVQIGAEMFENHQQWALDLYQEGKITADQFQDTVKLWGNYPTDYKPVTDFAVRNHIPVFATNIPRSYARVVAKNGLTGLDTVADERKKWIAPLPIEVNFELPSYKALLGTGHGNEMPGIQAKNFVSAQAIKDATMAYRIHTTYRKGSKYFHLNGSYHSDYKEGIIWYLRKHNPNYKLLNISTVYQDDLGKLETEHQKKADFILVVPKTMTQTEYFKF